jgi:hypothetical protein
MWLSRDNSAHYGDRLPGDIEIPDRPTAYHQWVDGAWTINKAAFNATIDGQIDALERAQLCPRFVREGLLIQWVRAAIAAGVAPDLAGVTAALRNSQSPAFDAGFARLYAFDQSIVALRAQKVPT